MPSYIDISGLNRADVLAVLYNNARQSKVTRQVIENQTYPPKNSSVHSHYPQQIIDNEMRNLPILTAENAQSLLNNTQEQHFDYLWAVPMKIQFLGNQIEVRSYDHNHHHLAGCQSAQSVIDTLKEFKFHQRVEQHAREQYSRSFANKIKNKHKQELYRQCGLQSVESPENRQITKADIGFESIRSLKRFYLWHILCHAADGHVEKAYEKLQKQQHRDGQINDDGSAIDDCLTRQTFYELVNYVSQLNRTQRQIAADTAFIHKSGTAASNLEKAGCESPDDAEIFLYKAAQMEKQLSNASIFAVTQDYTPEQKQVLTQCFPDSLHMRHFMFGEASAKEFQKAIQSIHQDEQTFNMGMARWLVDLLGFAGATTLTETNARRFIDVSQSMKTLTQDISLGQACNQLTSIVNNAPLYLGVTVEGDDNTRLLTNFLLAGCPITEQPKVAALNEAISEFGNKNQLANDYLSLLTDAEYMPTYMPAVLKGALKKSQQLYDNGDIANPIKTATQFALRVFDKAFQKQQDYPQTPIGLSKTAHMDNLQTQNTIFKAIDQGQPISIQLDEHNKVKESATNRLWIANSESSLTTAENQPTPPSQYKT